MPDSYAIDMSKDQVFSCQVQGSLIDAYDLIIKDLSNNTLYDSTKVTLNPVLYDKDTLNITIPANSISTKGQIKFTIATYSGSSNAISREIPFYNSSTPSATLAITSPITTKKINLQTIYTQAENVQVQSYQYFLYDSTGTTIIEQSDLIFSGKLQYSFDGLIDATSYQTQCIITNSYSQTVDTGKITFNVDYLQPNINLIPTATVNSDLSAIELVIGKVVQNIGLSTGTTTYVDNFLVPGNTGLQLLDNTSMVYWNVDISNIFTITFDWETNGFINGKIIKLEDDSGNYLEIGYNPSTDVSSWDSETIIDTNISLDLTKAFDDTADGAIFLNNIFSLSTFYLDVNGTVIEGIPIHLNSDVYVFGIRNQELIIQQSNQIVDIIKPWWIS